MRDPDGNGVLRPALSRAGLAARVACARPRATGSSARPRKLGHVNFLTGAMSEQVDFYTRVLGMEVTDWLGDGGVWLHINATTT